MSHSYFRALLLSTVAATALAPVAAKAGATVFSVTYSGLPGHTEIVDNYTTSFAKTAFQTDTGPNVIVVALPQFALPASMLAGITVKMTTIGSAEVTATNISATRSAAFSGATSTGTITLLSESDLFAAVPTTVVRNFAISSFSGTLAAGLTQAAMHSASFPLLAATTTVAAGNISDYLGTNPLGALFDITGDSVASGQGSHVGFSSTASVSGTVTLSYDTNILPEPGSLSVVGAGLVGMGVIRRRGKRAAV